MIIPVVPDIMNPATIRAIPKTTLRIRSAFPMLHALDF
jgi:hypothetical protein